MRQNARADDGFIANELQARERPATRAMPQCKNLYRGRDTQMSPRQRDFTKLRNYKGNLFPDGNEVCLCGLRLLSQDGAAVQCRLCQQRS
jgi:hypothetical protein